MQILFLGTSSGWPLPRLGCDCKICTSTDLKDIRLRPSILVNEKILVDAPPDIYHQLKRFKVDPTKITTIFLTHAHTDHIIGLYDLTHIYGRRDKISIISSERIISQATQKLGISMLSYRKIKSEPFEKIQLDKNTSCWLIPVEHSVEAYAIKIKGPKPIFYSPEFRKIRQSSKKELGNIDLAVIDGSSKSRIGQTKGHETIEEGIRLGKSLNAKKVLFTNIGHKTDTHEELITFVRERGRHKFGIAFDGLEVEL